MAPEIIDAILDGRQPAKMMLAALMEPFAVVWKEQTLRFVKARLAGDAAG